MNARGNAAHEGGRPVVNQELRGIFAGDASRASSGGPVGLLPRLWQRLLTNGSNYIQI